ncbi:MAG: peptide chain release factor 3 [Alphaproteobacteria bacterium]
MSDPASRPIPLAAAPALDPSVPPHARRRSFAIISHPDAGKTTLTEKLLLFGGAIRAAGQVRARGEARRTRSDWMAIERARGISVTSSVMTFERDGLTFNLLDTPGHEDFSEDTYRTLTAVDSAVMVIDAAKGIESQTRKLLEVCRLRDLPIVTFVNKVDREARDPFELLDEIADTLALDVSPLVWPVGTGSIFHGCYDLRANRFLKTDPARNNAYGEAVDCAGLDDPKLARIVPESLLADVREQISLAQAGYPEFDRDSYLAGHMTPVIFGSALKDFSVEELLAAIGAWAPPPRPQPAEPRAIAPDETKVAGFVFKVQANMDPNHRDRIAFMRICAGRFKRGMKLKQVRTDKSMAVQNPIFFFAQERELAEEAWPGDIIGIPNHGTLRVGDTLTEGESLRVTGLPNFAPEILRRARLEDPLKSKQLRGALQDLAEEGIAQVFRPVLGSDWVVGVVGALQLDVLASRIGAEYKVGVRFEDAGFEQARWVTGEKADIEAFLARNRGQCAEDRDGALVYLARNSWDLNRTMQDFPKLAFAATREIS